MADPISLGYLPAEVRRADIRECNACGSRDIRTVKEVDKTAAGDLIQSRASRLGLTLANYDVKVDRDTGQILATPKPVNTEGIDFG